MALLSSLVSRARRRRELPWDLIIVGGGVAGSAAALAARQCSARVALIDSGRCNHLPEMVPGLVRRTLATLCPSRLPFDYLHPIERVRTRWLDGVARERYAITDVDGGALYVNRLGFTVALREAAMTVGAVGFESTAAEVWQTECGWRVRLKNGVTLRGRRLLIAAGRRTLPPGVPSPRSRGIQRVAAALQWFDPEQRSATRSMLVAAVGAGWWYGLHDGCGRYTAVFVGAPASMPRRRSQDRDWLMSSMPEELLAVLETRRPSGGSAVSMHAAGIQYRMTAADPTWALAGDARIALDPLSGAGVLRAIEDGKRVARYLLEDDNWWARRRFQKEHAQEYNELSRELRRWSLPA